MESSRSRLILIIIMAAFLTQPLLSRAAVQTGDTTESLVNAFFLTELPAAYSDQERLVDHLKGGGANTIIIRAPFTSGGLNKTMLTNLVFLSHRAGMKLLVILPTRSSRSILALHPEWEDLRYDLRSRALVRSGRLDLFLPQAVNAIAAVAKDIASYSVDGILFAEDFSYGATEGTSPLALEAYRHIFGAEFDARKVWDGIGQEEQAAKLGEPFWNMADLKKNMLTNQIRAVAKAAWAVQPRLKLGLPLPVDDLMTPKDALALFSYDVDRFRKLNIDYYWVDIRHRDLRARQGTSYAKSMETVARIAKSASSLLNDGARMIITVQTMDANAKRLPLTEIEEAVSMVTQSGTTGIAFLVDARTQLPSGLTKKVFGRRRE